MAATVSSCSFDRRLDFVLPLPHWRNFECFEDMETDSPSLLRFDRPRKREASCRCFACPLPAGGRCRSKGISLLISLDGMRGCGRKHIGSWPGNAIQFAAQCPAFALL